MCAKYKGQNTNEDERLLQFLMTLNDVFMGVRSNILFSSPLLCIGQAYSHVVQDEKQREIHNTHVYQSDSTSFIAAKNHG